MTLERGSPPSLAALRTEIVAGAGAQGEGLGRRWDEAWAALARRVPLDAARPRVFLMDSNSPPRAVQGWWVEALERIGGEPFRLTPGSADAEVSWEEVLEFNPESVLLTLRGRGLSAPAELWMEVEGWDRVDAARSRRVFSGDDRFFLEPGPSAPAAAELLQNLLGAQFWGWPAVQDARLRGLKG